MECGCGTRATGIDRTHAAGRRRLDRAQAPRRDPGSATTGT
jgi:hypothetical protein